MDIRYPEWLDEMADRPAETLHAVNFDDAE